MKTNSPLKTTTFVISGILVGLILFVATGGLKTTLVRLGILQIQQDASYGLLTFEELANDADIIFIGRLLEISPTTWNQDNGIYWGDDAIEYHTLRFQVLQYVVNKISSGQTIEITIPGPSLLAGNQDYNLMVGDDVLVFAGRNNLAWREGGTKLVFTVMTDPYHSFFVRSSNGNFEGEVIHSLDGGDFTSEQISLPVTDITAKIKSLENNSTTP